jgi:hypothetical protein
MSSATMDPPRTAYAAANSGLHSMITIVLVNLREATDIARLPWGLSEVGSPNEDPRFRTGSRSPVFSSTSGNRPSHRRSPPHGACPSRRRRWTRARPSTPQQQSSRRLSNSIRP